jgi:hypothetical protein
MYSLLNFVLYTELFCSSGVNLSNTHLICTDCLSALHGLNCCLPNHPIITEILIQVSSLQKAGKSLMFCWVLGHTGLPGNETTSAADEVAACTETYF